MNMLFPCSKSLLRSLTVCKNDSCDYVSEIFWLYLREVRREEGVMVVTGGGGGGGFAILKHVGSITGCMLP